jgi:uncharacterized protein YebE (UPF0316 family)
MGLIAGYLIIFISRVVDVSMSTMRTLMVMQGRKVQAAMIGFFEIIIYITALNKVVSGLDNPLNLLAYALGFACGTYVGITIEGKIALGNLSAQVVLKTDENEELIETLRANGFGVTVLEGKGKDGKREILSIAMNRKDLDTLRTLVIQFDPKAFITVNSINPVGGGFFSAIKK